ncbi:MAG: cytochrome c5 family protein [Methylophilaceae bacterium]|nr:cytochrome c5 family protein [Methylophilaceae bacterium]
MSEHHYDFPKTTVKQVIFAALGGLIAPLIVITLIVNHVLAIQATHIEDPVTADAIKAANAVIEERIKPVAVVALAEKTGNSGAGQAGKSGEEIVNAVCSACHGAGVMGSPKLGDKAAWAPRIAQGYETLTKHAIEGIRQMPARGGGADLTDAEVASAVAYLANQAGAKFTAP